MASVKFIFNGLETVIQCLNQDKMIDICNKFASKIQIDINSIYFIYGGNQINLELTFDKQINSKNKNKTLFNRD